MKRVGTPNTTRLAATFASAPAKVTSSTLAWSKRRWSGVANRTINSPKVATGPSASERKPRPVRSEA